MSGSLSADAAQEQINALMRQYDRHRDDMPPRGSMAYTEWVATCRRFDADLHHARQVLRRARSRAESEQRHAQATT